MKMLGVLLGLWVIMSPLTGAAKKAQPFQFHLMAEPHTLDPQMVRGIAGSFLFANLYRSLYRYDKDQGLQPDGGHCSWKTSDLLHCKIQKSHKWSDGTQIIAEDYVRSFRRLVSPKTKSTHSEHLINILNARKVLRGQLPPEKLAVRALNTSLLEIQFSSPDPEFLYKSISAALAPRHKKGVATRDKAEALITNGPYRIKTWVKGKRLILTANDSFKEAAAKKLFVGMKPNEKQKADILPDVEIVFVEDTITALNLFETGRLSLLRRMPPQSIAAYKNRKEFFEVAMARFDYVGFGPELAPYPNLRKAMTLALKFKDLQKLYHSKSKPGCPSFPPEYMSPVHCLSFDLNQAKAALAKVPEEAKTKRWKFAYSKMGGEGVRVGMEWLQNQWKIHLGLDIELEPLEQGMFLQRLATSPPAIFRKGGSVDRPTCLAALEIFEKGHPENYVQLDNFQFSRSLKKLRQKAKWKKKRQLCAASLKALLNTHRIIPQGQIHYRMLQDGKFSGWTINELQQLDLTYLHRVSN